ncbi:MAG: hypothetical protein ABR541_08670 [Candidatus Dormibacteria bacterium]
MTAVQRSAGGDGPRCPSCGGALRLSHRRYLGSRRSLPVRRCEACTLVVEGRAQEDAEVSGGRQHRSRKPLPDEGPPPNPVLDDELAQRLRERFGPS